MLDLTRTVSGRELGNKDVDPNATFEAGMIGAYAADGSITTCDGSTETPAGILKFGKTSSVTGVEVSEAITFADDATTQTAVNLKHANVSNVKVENSAGTDYTVTTDYTVAVVNGTVTRNGSGGVAVTETVYVTYTYELSATERNEQGLNFNLNHDDTLGSNKIVIIQGLSTIYTDQYKTDADYAVEDVVYCGADGKFTKSDPGTSFKFGKVISVPTATDRFLGVEGNFTNDR